ncbi:hypothetical protein ACFRAU_12700 [Arthrobacter sp. NPDC056691]|uniref:hypothetical protein n=1 Tax=Arthrobacter sp. NPDC056691 TaxID=3345913 RepID=UPI003670A527
MPSNLPTTLAVSDAITHYRQLRELSCDELSYVLSMLGYTLSSDAIAAVENRERPVTVDDLVAISYALGTSPAVLLTHIPIDMPAPEGPLASGLPADVEPLELRAWAEGRTALDPRSRIGWWQDKVSRLRVLSMHYEEQLQGAYEEIRELGELALQEADAPPVQVLQSRIRDGEYALHQADLALATAEQQLEALRGEA